MGPGLDDHIESRDKNAAGFMQKTGAKEVSKIG